MIYEDESLIAMLSSTPATLGHIVVAPKQHAPIIEMVPDWIVGDLFTVANTMSTAVFEGLKAQGTNILVQNGIPAGQSVPHAHLSVIPRRENDGLPLMWQPRPIGPEELAQLETKLKDESKNIGPFQKSKPKPVEEKKPEPIREEQPGEENYQLRQLRRIP